MTQPHTPVLVGVGLITQREDDPLVAKEPIQLMIEAAEAAGADTDHPGIVQQLDRVLVPLGRWSYGNPGAMVARAVGSPEAATVSAQAGVSQQTLLTHAASAIASGEITTALVVGGEGGYRLQRARIAGVEVEDTPNDETADIVFEADMGIVQKYEHDAGLGWVPANYYALLESAWRYQQGLSIDEHRDLLATRYHRFSQTAAASPHGWDRDVTPLETIRDSPFMAFPYTRHHLSNWSVDQASALIMTSTDEAERLGISPDKWIFPQAFAESNHVTNVTARGEMHQSPGANLAGPAVLDAAGCDIADLDRVELYSCFPVAVEAYREAIGMAPEADASFTGGMPFGGGPFNNFVLHSTAQLAQLLRQDEGANRGMVTTVSGFLTKQGFAVWGTEPNPSGYTFVDVTEQVGESAEVRTVNEDYSGPAVIAAYTVVHSKAGPQRGVIVADTPSGERALASTDDPDVMLAMQTEEFCGLAVTIDGPAFART